MNTVFWTVVALDALMFLAMGVMTLQSSSGHNDGGKEMALFFFILLPCAVLGLAVLLYVFTSGIVWRSLALLVVAGPGLFIAGGQLRAAWMDHAVANEALGSGYFREKPMKAMGVAVVKRDIDTMRQLGRTVNVNIPGERGMTLLAMAVEQAGAEAAGPTPPSALQVVQTLLMLGAKPAQAMETAVKMRDPALLRMLLDAGGDPNMLAGNGQPLVFSWISVMPLDNLRLLAQHGLDLNSSFYGDPLAFVLTLHRRRDLLAFVIEQGADVSRPRADGRNAPDEIQAQIDEAMKAREIIPPELLQIKAMLAARKLRMDHDKRA